MQRPNQRAGQQQMNRRCRVAAQARDSEDERRQENPRRRRPVDQPQRRQNCPRQKRDHIERRRIDQQHIEPAKHEKRRRQCAWPRAQAQPPGQQPGSPGGPEEFDRPDQRPGPLGGQKHVQQNRRIKHRRRSQCQKRFPESGVGIPQGDFASAEASGGIHRPGNQPAQGFGAVPDASRQPPQGHRRARRRQHERDLRAPSPPRRLARPLGRFD